MVTLQKQQDLCHIYRNFSNILEYPSPTLSVNVKECLVLLESINSKATARLKKFQAFVVQTPLGQLEEIYSGTFDLQPKCYPYAGYHLFGENYKRGAFMVKLQEQYRLHDFSWEKELPDHIAVILRFLSILHDEEAAGILKEECLIPVLEKMLKAFGEEKTNMYTEAVQALLLLLKEVPKKSE